MMFNCPGILAHGAFIPSIGLGTWQAVDDDGANAVKWAVEAGYRHIDTAARYGNEKIVGEALKLTGLKREEYFVTTKVWFDDLADGALQRSAYASLSRLDLQFIDLLLIHWPNAIVPLADTIRALCETKRRGIARHIGVANFPVSLLKKAVEISTEPIVANQCECHPYLDQTKIIEACRSQGVAFIGYSPLGNGKLLNEPLLQDIASRCKKSVAQVLIRWNLQQGFAAIPKSTNRQRIFDNVNVFDFGLNAEEMLAISKLAKRDGRIFSPSWAPEWD